MLFRSYDLANLTTAYQTEKDPEKRAAIENKITGIKAGLSALDYTHGGTNTFKTGVELRNYANQSQKALDKYVAGLDFLGKQPSALAKNEEYQRLLAARNEAVAAHRQYIANNSDLLGEQTPPPAVGAPTGAPIASQANDILKQYGINP